MPRETKYCMAPRAWDKSRYCGKPFLATVPTQLYCCRTCANRAHRWVVERNKRSKDHAAGVKVGLTNPLAAQILSAAASTKAAAEMDQEAELAKLGYAADPHDLSKERREALGMKVKPDRSAEPQSGPPQFDNSDLEDNDPFNYRAEKL